MLKFSYQLLVVLHGDCWHQLHFHTFRPRTMLSKMLWQRSGEGSQPRRSPKDAGGVFLALENLQCWKKEKTQLDATCISHGFGLKKGGREAIKQLF